MHPQKASRPGRCEAPGPRAIDQLPGKIDRDATLSPEKFQAGFLVRRHGLTPIRAAVVASLAFAEARL